MEKMFARRWKSIYPHPAPDGMARIRYNRSEFRVMTQRRFCILGSIASVIALAIGVFVFTAHPTLAQGTVANLTEVADATNLGQEDIRIIIGRIVRIVLGFLGIVAVLLVMYGGFLWMTDRK